jgi:hypothetical protein
MQQYCAKKHQSLAQGIQCEPIFLVALALRYILNNISTFNHVVCTHFQNRAWRSVVNQEVIPLIKIIQARTIFPLSPPEHVLLNYQKTSRTSQQSSYVFKTKR